MATIDKPWTAQEFDQALQKIKASGKYQHPLDLGTGDTSTEWWTYAYSPFLQSFGGDLIDRTTYKTADGVLNGDKALAWATWFQGLVKDKGTPRRSRARTRSPTSSTASRPWFGRASGARRTWRRSKTTG